MDTAAGDDASLLPLPAASSSLRALMLVDVLDALSSIYPFVFFCIPFLRLLVPADRATDASVAPAETAADGSSARKEVSSSDRPTGEERRRAPAGRKEGEERRCVRVGDRREGGRGAAARGDRW
ncbi:Os06g0146750 [Oryza sativa Japonica Group]|jgi:hypothetical protein|uniref:Os06g0146750 protein n=1 Tax=Oryza sativa subsp. japonica TaxID=39947 RepID=A0A0P0WSU0_ORYSJ|nr:Os06g0146750 [Oryza sativa Japonica Group]